MTARKASFVCLALTGYLAAAAAEQKEEKDVKPLVIHVGTTIWLQASSKKQIVLVVNEKEEHLRVSIVDLDPTTIRLTGMAPGKARLTITDVDKMVDTYDVTVRRRVALPVDVATTLDLPIAFEKIANENEKVAKVTRVNDNAKQARIEAVAAGKSACVFTDKNGKAETYDIEVIKPDRTIVVGETDSIKPLALGLTGISTVKIEETGVVAMRPVEPKNSKDSKDTSVGIVRMFIDPIKPPEVWQFPRGFDSIEFSITGLRVGVTAVTFEIARTGKTATIHIAVVPKK